MQKVLSANSLTKTILTGFFAFTLFFTHQAQAATLPVGNISTCGTLAAAGTYSLTTNISSVSGPCFVITSNGVTLTSTTTQHYTVTAAGGNTAYAVVATSTVVNGGSAYGTTTIQNITFTGFGGGVNESGNPSSNISVVGGNGGNVSISSSTIGDIASNGANGFATGAGGIGGNIITTNSTTGVVSSSGGMSSAFIDLGSASGIQNWNSITSTPSGDVYALAQAWRVEIYTNKPEVREVL